MLTYLLLFVLPGCVVFGGAAWLWRYPAKRPRPHWLIAVSLSAVAWFASWLFGVYLFLDVIRGGAAGAVAGPGLLWSIVAAIVFYKVLRSNRA